MLRKSHRFRPRRVRQFGVTQASKKFSEDTVDRQSGIQYKWAFGFGTSSHLGFSALM